MERVHDVEREFLTSADVAEILGVGPTSVKRWADSGLLPCVRTPGGHRRFLRAEVQRFLERGAGGWGAKTDTTGSWVERLNAGQDAFELQSALFAEHSRHGKWWPVAETLAGALKELGERWERGESTILDGHAASEGLARAIARCAEAIHVEQGAPLCLLATCEGEDHELPLALAELVLREGGWRARWGGRATPVSEISRLVREGELDMVVVCAGEGQVDAASLKRQSDVLTAAALESGVHLVLGGHGAWPTISAESEAGFESSRTVRRCINEYGKFHELLDSGLPAKQT